MAFLAKFKGKISTINRQGNIGEAEIRAQPANSKTHSLPNVQAPLILPETKSSQPEVVSRVPAVGTAFLSMNVVRAQDRLIRPNVIAQPHNGQQKVALELTNPRASQPVNPKQGPKEAKDTTAIPSAPLKKLLPLPNARSNNAALVTEPESRADFTANTSEGKLWRPPENPKPNYSPVLKEQAGDKINNKNKNKELGRRSESFISRSDKEGNPRDERLSNGLDRQNLRELGRRLLAPPQQIPAALPQVHSSGSIKNKPLVVLQRVNLSHHSRKQDNLGQSSSLQSLNSNSGALHRGLEDKRSSLAAVDSHSMAYKPYTLREYQILKPGKYYTLGGLGPNIGTEAWEAKQSQRERMRHFAHDINLANISRLLARFNASSSRPVAPGKHQLPEVERAHEVKRRMLDYASHVPKPKLAQIYEREELEEAQATGNEPFKELAILEQQHHKLLQELNPFPLPLPAN